MLYICTRFVKVSQRVSELLTFPRDVLDQIWDLIESVSGGFSYLLLNSRIDARVVANACARTDGRTYERTENRILISRHA